MASFRLQYALTSQTSINSPGADLPCIQQGSNVSEEHPNITDSNRMQVTVRFVFEMENSAAEANTTPAPI